MKKKWFKNKALIDAITKTTRFKVIFFFVIIIALIGGLTDTPPRKELFTAIINYHSSFIFTIGFSLVFLLATLNTCLEFYANDTYLIRLKNKKNVLKHLIILVLQINGLLFLCYAIVYILVLNINMLDCYDTIPIFQYSIKSNIYSIFFAIRAYLLIMIFMVINTILFVILKENKTIIINLIYLLIFPIYDPLVAIHFRLLPWDYFSVINYGCFAKELKYSIFYILLLVIVSILLFIFATKKKTERKSL